MTDKCTERVYTLLSVTCASRSKSRGKYIVQYCTLTVSQKYVTLRPYCLTKVCNTSATLYANLFSFCRPVYESSALTSKRTPSISPINLTHLKSFMDNIKMDLQEVECESMDWIDLAQDRDRWRALVTAVMDLRVP